MAKQPAWKKPASAALSQDNQIKILLTAYQKHAAELLAIEASQEKLNNLVLGIYSAGLALVAGLVKDAKAILQGPGHTPSAFAWGLMAVAVIIGVYAVYMSVRRSNARQGVRKALTQTD
jgi:hypothetical protein